MESVNQNILLIWILNIPFAFISMEMSKFVPNKSKRGIETFLIGVARDFEVNNLEFENKIF